MAEDKKTTLPRFPENRWWQLRKQFMRTMPKSVDANYLGTIFSIEKGAAANLVPVLKQLGLIDIEGKPTDLANKWRHNESYSEACHSMLEDIYPQGLRDVEPGPDVDRARVTSWITRNTSLGDGAAGGCASLYKLIVEADVSKEPEAQPAKVTNGKKPMDSKKPEPQVQIAPGPKPASAVDSPKHPPTYNHPEPRIITPTVHLDVQIHISPEASNEQIEKIFESMGKHIFNRGLVE